MTRALQKLAADLNLDLQAIADSPPSGKGSDARRVAAARRARQSYEAILLAFHQWCQENDGSFFVEMRRLLLARMGMPITLPPPPPMHRPRSSTPERSAGQFHRGGKRALRPVLRDADGVPFDSIAAAARSAGVAPPSLVHAIAHRRLLAGSTWSFAETQKEQRA